ncbi:MAG: trypsin-like peptidase domain-containing protein [Chloroflexia bacterium]|nr:trypsin-like peptidase domain-containing protein [Chloroflexia bacterium]
MIRSRILARPAVAVLAAGLVVVPAAAQEPVPAAPGVAIARGPLTAWCEPGQTLLGGGFDLLGTTPAVAEPPAEGEDAPALPPPPLIATNRPTARPNADGGLAQTGWTVLPNSIIGTAAGPLYAYALCLGEPAAVPESAPLPPLPRLPEAPPAPLPPSDPVDAVAVFDEVAQSVVTVIVEGPNPETGRVEPISSGSGFFIDEAGHIVTNNHVVDGGAAFSVVLSDGSERPATPVGGDPTSDLAVLKVDGPVPDVLSLGDSDALRPGQAVLAIGSPLGTFANTITDGIVGAVARTLPADAAGPELLDLIQHNAAINPGNSGGPLVTLTGEVVGVNTAGFEDTQGLFFAVPSRTVVEVSSQLIADGRVDYPFMGVTVFPLDEATIAQWELPVASGSYVESVVPDGPSAQAGIMPGDVVVAIELEPVSAERSLAGVLFRYVPGETVQATIQRGTERFRLAVTLAVRPVTLEVRP